MLNKGFLGSTDSVVIKNGCYCFDWQCACAWAFTHVFHSGLKKKDVVKAGESGETAAGLRLERFPQTEN